MLDDGYDLLLPLLVLTLPCILKTLMKVLLSIMLAMFLKVIALTEAHLDTLENLVNGKRDTVKNFTMPGGPLEIALFLDKSSVITKERAIYLGATNP